MEIMHKEKLPFNIGQSFKPVRFLVFFFLLSLVALPGIAQKKTVVPTANFQGYSLRDTNFSRKDFNVWVVTTALSFDSLFTSIDSTLRKPNFDEEIVLAIKAETVRNVYETKFKEMILQRRILRVYFKVSKEDKDKEGVGWVTITSIPKDKTIRRVNFYFDDMMVRSIPVVVVY
jgi:hypothetical protein